MAKPPTSARTETPAQVTGPGHPPPEVLDKQVSDLQPIATKPVKRTRPRSQSFQIDRSKVVDSALERYNQDKQDRQGAINHELQLNAKFRGWRTAKDWPWENACNSNIPVMMTDSLRVQDTLHNAFLSSRPPIGSKALNKDQAAKERKVDLLLDYQFFNEQKGEETAGDFIYDFVNRKATVAFVPWVREERTIQEPRFFPPIPEGVAPGQYFAAILAEKLPPGSQSTRKDEDGWSWESIVVTHEGTQKVKIDFYTEPDDRVVMLQRKTVRVYDGPRVLRKAWEQVIWPVRAANLQPPGPSNPGGARHVAIVDWPSTDEIRLLHEQGYYDQCTEEEIQAIEAHARGQQHPAQGDTLDEPEQQKDALEGTVDTAHYRGVAGQVTRLMIFDRWDVDGDGLEEDVIWWIIEETHTLLKAKYLTEQYPLNPPRRPLAHEAFLPVPGRVLGISLLEEMESLHDLIKMNFDQMFDAGTITNAPFFFYKASSAMRPEIIRLWPGEGYPLGDPKNDVYFPTFQNATQAYGMNMDTRLNDYKDKLTLITPLQLGGIPTGKSAALRTAAGMSAVLQQGDARPERVLRRFFRFMSEIWRLMYELDKAFLPKNKQIRITGVSQPNEDPFITIGDPQEIDAVMEFDFMANILNTNKALMQQAMQAMLAAYASPMFVQYGLIDAEGLYRMGDDYGKALGQDPTRYLKAPSPQAAKPKYFAAQALSLIINGELPDGMPAEAGGIEEHIQAIQNLQDTGQAVLTEVGQHLVQMYLQRLHAMVQQQQQQAMQMQSAQQFQMAMQQGGGGGPSSSMPPDMTAPAVQNNELLDESLPGAGGGANG